MICLSHLDVQYIIFLILIFGASLTFFSRHPCSFTNLADMKANNYQVVESGEVIRFQGIVQRSTSQACFLVFCTLIAMASLALVLQIQLQ